MIGERAESRPVIASRSPWLRGRIRPPGDPVVGRIALMLAALARGESVIDRLPQSPDVLLVVEALRALGANCDKRADRWHVQGVGTGGLLEPRAPIRLAGRDEDALLLGLVGLLDMPVPFTGLVHGHAVDEVLLTLRRHGTEITGKGDLLTLRGNRFTAPLEVTLEHGGLAKAALLLAALSIRGDSSISAPPSISHGERQLRSFGAGVEFGTFGDNEAVRVTGLSPLRAQAVVLPSDPALAAVPAVAALIAAESEVVIDAVATDPYRTGLLAALMDMGADIDISGQRVMSGEDVADLTVRASTLRATHIGPLSGVAIEDYPLLAVAAAFAEGETPLEGHIPHRSALVRALRVNGVHCDERMEGVWVRGGKRVPGGSRLPGKLDPRLAMAFLIMGMASAAPVGVDDINVANETYPNFVEEFERLGASFTEPKA
jgi:3-phosphoshikimate 1-carboxyvinyltransferase